MANTKPLGYGREIECPRCQEANVEPLPFLYKSLKSKGAGRKLFLEESFILKTTHLSVKDRERLLHRITPAEEPKRDLPAGLIAFMAFLISWLVTSGFIARRLGQDMIFIASAVVVGIIFVPYCLILQQVIKDFIKQHQRYRRIMAVWNKQYYCRDCGEIFIPKKD